MKLAIMQPYLFPYLGYFQLINAVDKFVVYDDVTFIKQGWINRNQILVNHTNCFFSVPLDNLSSFKLIKDTQIYLQQYPRWKSKLLKTLTLAYQKAPYFSDFFPIIERVFDYKSDYIADLCRASLTEVCEYLEIKTSFIATSVVFDNAYLNGQNRVIDICLKEEAQTYINPLGGLELYNKSDFAKNNIDLYFIKPKYFTYPQFGKGFVPHLSIIDVLMFNSKKQAIKKLSNFDLD